MKNKYTLVMILLLSTVYFNTGCKKEKEKPDELSPEYMADIGTVGSADVTNCSAVCYGLVGLDKGYTVTERGFCYSTDIDPNIAGKHIVCGQGSGNFEGTLTLLLASTRYYVRAYAINKAGTSYGSTISFVTAEASEPVIKIYDATNVTDKTASVRVEITSTGGGIIQLKGVCLSMSHEPTIADTVFTSDEQTVNLTIELNNLKPNSEYYYGGFVKTEQYTTYSEYKILKTQVSLMEPVKDFEGHSYRTSEINGQVWMIDNLRTKFLNDGTPIEYSTWFEWTGLSTPAYTYKRGMVVDSSSLVYNYYVINTGKICPHGWHVPDYEEWENLLDYVEWQSDPLLEFGSNTSGFSAQRYFILLSNGDARETTYYWIADYNYSAVSIEYEEPVNIETMGANAGVPIRCVKN